MLTLAIQAGGGSSRMQQDKALMSFLGKPLIVRVFERLAVLADEIIVTTNQTDAFSFLGVRPVADLEPGRGALGGLFTALSAASYANVAVVACDMPFASQTLFTYEYSLLIQNKTDAVIPSTAGGLEPLHAVYRRQACLPAIRSALDKGEWKLISWLPWANARVLSPEETAHHDPGGLAFFNVNTPEDLLKAEQLARNIKN